MAKDQLSGARKVSTRVKALVVAPTGWGSVGDDALLRGACNFLVEKSISPIVLTGSNADMWQIALRGIGNTVQVLSTRHLLSPLGLRAILSVRDVYIIGADVIDGGYDVKSSTRRLLFARIFCWLGKRVSVISFSFNKLPKVEIVSAFRRLGGRVRYAVRDRLSHQRFIAQTGLDAELVADIGFLTRPVQSPEVVEVCNWAEKQRDDGNIVLFVNLNIGPFRSNPATRSLDKDEIVGGMIEVLGDLQKRLGRGLSVAVVPHDFRDPTASWSDTSLATSLYSQLAVVLDDRRHLIAKTFSSAEMCAMVGSADLVITGRMHLAILALTAGVLPVSFTYQDKFEGMYQHFFVRPNELMLSTEALFADRESVVMRLSSLLGDRQTRLCELEASRALVLQLARRNFFV